MGGNKKNAAEVVTRVASAAEALQLHLVVDLGNFRKNKRIKQQVDVYFRRKQT